MTGVSSTMSTGRCSQVQGYRHSEIQVPSDWTRVYRRLEIDICDCSSRNTPLAVALPSSVKTRFDNDQHTNPPREIIVRAFEL